MRHRFAGSIALAGILLLSVAGTASAGGWSVTTFDQLPAEFRAGQVYPLGYRVLQHGVRPVDRLKTEIHIRAVNTGETHSFPGIPDGAPGHYVAEVRFPAAGEWSRQVAQGPFAMQELGTIGVGAPEGAAAAPEPQPWLPPLVPWLPIAAALAAALFVSQLATLRWARPRAG